MIGEVKDFLLQQKTLQDWCGYSLLTRCLLLENKFSLKVDQTTLRKFYVRNGIKNYSLSYTYQQAFANTDERQKTLFLFTEKLAQAIVNGDLVVYFDSASFNMWGRNKKSWSRYEQPVKMVLNKNRCTSITVMGAICAQFNRKPLFIQSATTTSDLIVTFLPQLRAMFPLHRDTRIKLVVDNARAH